MNEIADKQDIVSVFPNISEKLIDDVDGIDLLVNVTKDINKKTAEENNKYEQTFRKKPLIVTYSLIAVCVLMFLFELVYSKGLPNALSLFVLGGNYGPAVRVGEFYRLITSAFLHADIAHLIFNMYALYALGTQVETVLGKKKFFLIYLISAVCGSLMSIMFNDVVSVGASGAIFGVLGSLIYFCYYYRLYFGNVLKTKIIPVLVLNVILGVVVQGIDLAAHIGGLVGGILATMALGIDGKSKTGDKVNGIIVLILFIAFITYMGIFAK